ncbi:hypothetical protein J6590_022553, partial [Homalodisca vitripennis]
RRSRDGVPRESVMDWAGLGKKSRIAKTHDFRFLTLPLLVRGWQGDGEVLGTISVHLPPPHQPLHVQDSLSSQSSLSLLRQD